MGVRSANEMGLTHGEGQQGDQFFDAVYFGEMGLFEIKASAFEIGKEDFDTPSFFVDQECVNARCVATDHHPVLRASDRREIERLSIDAPGFWQGRLLIQGQVGESFFLWNRFLSRFGDRVFSALASLVKLTVVTFIKAKRKAERKVTRALCQGKCACKMGYRCVT